MILQTENSLRDVLYRYISAATTWLIGYNAQEPLLIQLDSKPIRSQHAGTPWLTGLSTAYLADAWQITESVDSVLANEVVRKIVGRQESELDMPGAIRWMLQGRSATWPVITDALVYDISVTTLGLLKWAQLNLRSFFGEWDDQLRSDLENATRTTTKWIEQHLKDKSWLKSDLANNGGQHTGRALELMVYSQATFPEQFGTVDNTNSRSFDEAMDTIVRFLKTRRKEPDGVSTINRELFYGLAHLLNNSDLRGVGQQGAKYRDDILLSLEGYADWYEKSLVDRLGGGFASGSRNLAVYVWVTKILSQYSPSKGNLLLSERTVWAGLRNLIHGNWYPDGSIFDSALLETVWFLGCLVAAYHWEPAEKSVMDMYDSVLMSSARTQLLEQEEIFDLKQEVIKQETLRLQLKEERAKERQKTNRERQVFAVLFGFVFVSYLIAFLMPLLGITSPIINPEFVIKDLESAIALIALFVPTLIAVIAFFIAGKSN